jgi:hypothetical protein
LGKKGDTRQTRRTKHDERGIDIQLRKINGTTAILGVTER